METQAGWEREEFELGIPGHYDFWLRNPRGEPVSVRLAYLSCACAAVKVGQLEPADVHELQARAAAVVAMPAAGLAEAWRHDLEARLRWQPLEVINGNAVKLPALVVRLSWEGKKLGSENLAATIELNGADRRLEVPIKFVPPVQVSPEVAQIRDLAAPGQKESVEFDCWTSTRDAFTLMPAVPKPGPCFEVSWRLLDAEQRAKLEADRNTRVRAGYRVTVTVHERRSDQELLDLGRFRRKIALAVAGLDVTLELEVAGVVRGDVSAVNPEDRDQIDLKTFPRDKGTTKQVMLEVAEGGPELRLVSGPKEMEVKLEPKPAADGRKRWELYLRVPPGGPSGPLPADCAIVLELLGETNRRFRIPVIGTATQR